jgi:hypothetical protein
MSAELPTKCRKLSKMTICRRMDAGRIADTIGADYFRWSDLAGFREQQPSGRCAKMAGVEVDGIAEPGMSAKVPTLHGGSPTRMAFPLVIRAL